MPHPTTWTWVFGQAAAVKAVEQAVALLTARAVAAEVPCRVSIIVNLDGKTVRGTIPLGQTASVHLLFVYQTDAGSVRAQVAVEHKTNEIGTAPRVLRSLQLTGVVVTAMQCSPGALSTQIVEAGGA